MLRPRSATALLLCFCAAACTPPPAPAQAARAPRRDASAAWAAAQEAPKADRRHRRTEVVEVFEKCRDAVVNISTTRVVRVRSPFGFGSIWDDIFEVPRERSRAITSVGSGFILHPDGFVVTNAHVVAQTVDIRIASALHDSVPADIVAVDADHDLAVLKMRTDQPQPYLRLARPGDIMVGETVVAIGNPFGLQHTVTRGIVSAVGRDVRFSEDVVYRDLIQTDAAINPGNSGGPLLNVDAELIGVNTAIRGDAQNIGFAIPVARLWELLPVMLDVERRQRVRVGLEVDGPQARVVRVRPDTPAARAGVRPGDRIVAFNGQAIENGIDYYVRLLEHDPGRQFGLAVQRGDRTLSFELPKEIVPPPDGARLAQQRLGMTLVPIPARLRRELELPDHVGLIVDAVERGGPADRARIERGDLILRLDRTPVTTLEDVGSVLERAEPGGELIVDGWRWRDDPSFPWSVRVRTRG